MRILLAVAATGALVSACLLLVRPCQRWRVPRNCFASSLTETQYQCFNADSKPSHRASILGLFYGFRFVGCCSFSIIMTMLCCSKRDRADSLGALSGTKPNTTPRCQIDCDGNVSCLYIRLFRHRK